ncbi:hypothetical protein [Curtobacterium sp. ZW137]|uniref:hypothetical protein n=1 Tax=Curtobacterium sp. ZW137 TaxID=2485104 RepID=UPI000F4CCA66|nr:hypothetical protein [Curtobacterium sp. ZW137]
MIDPRSEAPVRTPTHPSVNVESRRSSTTVPRTEVTIRFPVTTMRTGNAEPRVMRTPAFASRIAGSAR